MKRTRVTAGIACLVSFVAILAACSKTPEPAAQTAEPTVPVGRLGAEVQPLHYRLELRIDPREERFSGNVEIDVVLEDDLDSFWLHGKDLDVTEAWFSDSNGKRIDATYEERDATGVALVSLATPAEAGQASLHFTWSAAFNPSVHALYTVSRNDDHYAATQFQAIGARQVFPGFDEPAFKVPFDLALVVPEGDTAITSTPEASVEKLADGMVRRIFETTRPMPTYLLAFAVGPYDVVDYGVIPPNDVRDREVRLRGVVARGLAHRVEYALENTDGILTVLEEYFGTPYPYKKLDLIAVPASFGGAMENIGAIVYDEYLLLMDENSPLRQRRAYTKVHAHEIAHMWFGNLVTPEWWNDIWLNESFASWMEYKAAIGYWPEGEFDREILTDALDAMSSDSLAAARQVREPVDHSSAIEDAFDRITYQKGGGVLAMLERYVGEEAFRDGVRLHMQRHADGTATAEDFIASVAEGSDRTEIAAAFKSFIEQPGVPLLSVQIDCSANGDASLRVEQSRYAPLGSSIDTQSGVWQVPMCVSYGANGETGSSCAFLANKTQSVSIDVASCPDWVHPNADGAGYYRFALDDAGWRALIDNADQLSASEALVLVDSLNASLWADRISASNYVAAVSSLLQYDAWDVTKSIAEYLENLVRVIEGGDDAALRGQMSALIRPVYENLGNPDDAGKQILKEQLLRFLVIIARDEELRAPLVEQASARIGLDGEPDPAAVPVGMLESALSVGVQNLGEPLFTKLMAQVQASQDPTFRRAAVAALSRTEDPDLSRRLQSAILGGDFKGTEAMGIVFRQMGRPATADLTVRWLQDSWEPIVEMIPEMFRARVVPAFGSYLCTAQQADEWQAFIEGHAADLPGYERALAKATETIRLCAALKQANGEELVEAFSSL